MDKKDHERQLIIANSLYELGLDEDVIKCITTIDAKDLDLYRLSLKKESKSIDKTKK